MLTGFKFMIWIHIVALAFSLILWRLYGISDYSKFQKSGPYRVGVKEFKTEEFNNDCTVYYPAAQDGSGKLGMPFLCYDKDQLLGLTAVFESQRGFEDILKLPEIIK